jgi:hypothetical protein
MICQTLPFPYPYTAAVAICNDLDGCTGPEHVTQLHTFLNTTAMTPYGNGLGLEIGDSFWVHTPGGGFSYCREWSTTRSEHAGFIKDCVQKGWMDVLHSFGDFSRNAPPPSRDLCLRALDLLSRDQIKVDTWTDHGDRCNIQNFRLDGANPARAAYHADETLKFGIRYVWRSDLTSIAGQAGGRTRTLRSLLPRAARKLHSIRRHGRLADSMGEMIRSSRRVLNNRLSWQETLPDGQRVTIFQRLHAASAGVWSAAGPEGLAIDLSDAVLGELMRTRSASVIYVHMYYRQAIPEEPVLALRRLAELHHQGRIWVAGTSRLLNYADMVSSTRISVDQLADGGFVVRVTNPSYHSPEALSGLSLASSTDRITAVEFEGRNLSSSIRPAPGTAAAPFCICIH